MTATHAEPMDLPTLNLTVFTDQATLLAALENVVARRPQEHVNPDRHNSNSPSGLTAVLALELGASWAQVHGAEDLLNDLDNNTNPGAPIHFSAGARAMWVLLDDLADLGWQWQKIQEHMTLTEQNRVAPPPF